MSDLIRRLVIFLIRKRLGLKKQEIFQFTNQKSDIEYYWFSDINLMKMREDGISEKAHVSLNWLLDDDCEITWYAPWIENAYPY